CLAVGAVNHGLHPCRVPLEGGPLLAGLHVPQLDRLVHATRGQRPTVGAVRYREHLLLVPLEGVPQFGLLCRQGRQNGQPQAGQAQPPHHPLPWSPIRLHRSPPVVSLILPSSARRRRPFVSLPDTIFLNSRKGGRRTSKYAVNALPWQAARSRL